ncbi:hypothetical protein F2Q68_00018969 [Brassica cretica]|uniref:RRM domain-containing protein n=1 Tax=Brassica cretica TaxID=69181 RepID=A0A8S9G6M1_BRACR|nr:hypothetical protein F2Q68_00018969 [Brassica cretica]
MALEQQLKKEEEDQQAVATLCCTTGRARGFSFVVFTDPFVAERVTMEKHTIDGRTAPAQGELMTMMTYMFRDETEEEKNVAEGSEAAKKDTKKPKEIGYGVKKLTIINYTPSSNDKS